VVAAGHVLQDDGNQQVPSLDALTLLAVEQSLPASEPSHRGRGLAAEQQVMADPPGATRRARGIGGIQVGVMGALEPAYIVDVAAEHVRRPRQQLKILSA
jgi:hypothetical protein